MKNLKLKSIVLATALAISGAAFANNGNGNGNNGNLDQESANVYLNLGLYAKISGLDDFTLLPTGADGAAGAVYTGSDNFNLESNGQVRVVLEGGDLTNGSDSIDTTYDMDSVGMVFQTAANSVHNENHVVSATAELDEISSQLSGSYSSEITITVSAL